MSRSAASRPATSARTDGNGGTGGRSGSPPQARRHSSHHTIALRQPAAEDAERGEARNGRRSAPSRAIALAAIPTALMAQDPVAAVRAPRESCASPGTAGTGRWSTCNRAGRCRPSRASPGSCPRPRISGSACHRIGQKIRLSRAASHKAWRKERRTSRTALERAAERGRHHRRRGGDHPDAEQC